MIKKNLLFSTFACFSVLFTIHINSSQQKGLIDALELANSLPQKTTPQQKKPTTSNPKFILIVGDLLALPVDCIVNAANSNIQGGGGIDKIITSDNDNKGYILAELYTLKETLTSPIIMVQSNAILPEGQAVITSSGDIINKHAKTIRFVIATVGPQSPADATKDRELYNAYHNSLLLAANVQNKAIDQLTIIDRNYEKTTEHYNKNHQSNRPVENPRIPLLAQNYKNNPIRTVAFPSISTGIFGYPAEHAAPAAISGCIKAMQEHPQSFDAVYLVIRPDDIKKNPVPYQTYLKEIKDKKYTLMHNNANQPSNVTIVHIDQSKKTEIIYNSSSK